MKELLENLNNAIENFEFPHWDNGDGSTITGGMKMIGFKSPHSVSIVFETVCFSKDENLIKNEIYCYSSQVKRTWLENGGSVFFNLNTIDKTQDTFTIEVKGNSYLIDIKELKQTIPFEKALLLTLIDTVGIETLAGNPLTFIKAFELNPESKIEFETTQWKHPTLDEIDEAEGKLPEDNDVYNAAVSLIEDKEFKVNYEPNTDWRTQFG